MKRPSRLALFREAVRGFWQGPIYSSDPNLREFFGSVTTTNKFLQLNAGNLFFEK